MSESPAPRPSWQFSGRRGTPVHKRNDATAALPPEIRQVVDQLARERTGDKPATPTASATRATAATPAAGLRRPASAQPTPVSATPAPVERRTSAAPDPLARPTVIPVQPPSTSVTPPEAPVEPTAAGDPIGIEPASHHEEEASLLQRTRRLISLPLRRGARSDEPDAVSQPDVTTTPAPAPRDVPAAEPAVTPTPVAAIEADDLAAPTWPNPEPAELEPAPTHTSDAPALDAPAPAAQLPDAVAGLESARIASSLVGHAPIIAELAPAPAPEPASPRIDAAPRASMVEAVTDAPHDTDVTAPETHPAAPVPAAAAPSAELEPEPASPTAAPSAGDAPNAPKSVRPRSGKRGGKRRRGSLAWESARPRTPLEADDVAPVTRGATTNSAAPDAIARLDEPLHVPAERTMDEPRFTRQRAVARRSELDVALSALDAFVDTTASRRS